MNEIEEIKKKILNYLKPTRNTKTLKPLDDLERICGYTGVSAEYLAEYVCQKPFELVVYALCELSNNKLLTHTWCDTIRTLSWHNCMYYPKTYINLDMKHRYMGHNDKRYPIKNSNPIATEKLNQFLEIHSEVAIKLQTEAEMTSAE